jgi:osmotically inducible protein OsmC
VCSLRANEHRIVQEIISGAVHSSSRRNKATKDIVMKVTRRSSVVWHGGFKDGRGTISTESGALEAYPYGYNSRFEGVRGSNPEELVGAALSSCFTMSVAAVLSGTKFVADQIDTSAAITLEDQAGGYAITAAHVTLQAKIPAIDKDTFDGLVATAKAGCPVSKLLKVDVTVEATLLS